MYVISVHIIIGFATDNGTFIFTRQFVSLNSDNTPQKCGSLSIL